MLKSLRSKFSRSKTVSEEQIRRHHEQKRQRDEWKEDVETLRRTLDRLRTAYSQHKGDFALGRYEELKTMVKTAVEELNKTLAAQKERQRTGQRSAGRATGLRGNAAEFANVQRRLKDDDKLYAGMTAAEVDDQVEQFRREVLQLKQEFRVEREKLEALSAAYQESKQQNPAQRYVTLKDMIKDATEQTPSASRP